MVTSQVAGEKLIALKLYDLHWIDRFWLLQRLPKDLRGLVKVELGQLKRMGIENSAQLLLQFEQQQTQLSQPKVPASEPHLAQLKVLALSEPLRLQLEQLCQVKDDVEQPQLRQAVFDYLASVDSNRGGK